MTVKLDTTQLDRIANRLDKSRDAVVLQRAFKMEEYAKRQAPFDTSALKNSIYVEGKGESHYTVASTLAKGLRPGVRTQQHPQPGGKIIANVGPCVEYAAYVEYGTSKMGAQPYLEPAVEQVAKELADGTTWKELFE